MSLKWVLKCILKYQFALTLRVPYAGVVLLAGCCNATIVHLEFKIPFVCFSLQSFQHKELTRCPVSLPCYSDPKVIDLSPPGHTVGLDLIAMLSTGRQGTGREGGLEFIAFQKEKTLFLVHNS